MAPFFASLLKIHCYSNCCAVYYSGRLFRCQGEGGFFAGSAACGAVFEFAGLRACGDDAFIYGLSCPGGFFRGNFIAPLFFCLKFLLSPSTRSGRAGAPTFLLLQKSRQKTGAREFHPLANPRTKVGCWTPPFGNPQVLAGAVNLAELLAASRLELRCRWGRPRARARSPRLPHLHRFVWGLRPLAPQGFQTGKFAGRAPVGGFGPPCPRVSQREKFADHARTRMVPRSLRLCGQRPRKSAGSSCREAARSSVTPLARLWPQATLARPPVGESQRGRSPLWPVFAYFLLARK